MTTSSKPSFLAGILLIVLFSCTACYLADFSWVKQLRFSPLIVGIIVGMLFANTLRRQVPAEWNPGISFCSKQILRTGIVLYGFRITLGDVIDVGWAAVIVDVAIVALTLIIGCGVGRLLRMDSQTALLTSVGSSICGAAAVLGAEPVVKGEAYKSAVAVSTVVLFGTLAMFLYPAAYRADMYDMDAREVGIYTGATLHEVAHVVGAGEAMNGTDDSVSSACARMTGARRELNAAVDQHLAQHPELVEELRAPREQMNQACDQLRGNLCTIPDFAEPSHPDIQRPAVIVKMVRVILLAPVLIVLSIILSRTQSSEGDKRGKVSVPLFAVLFLVVIGINSFNFIPAAGLKVIEQADTFLLTMAMTALGVETSFDKFMKAGPKPFILALILFVWLVFGGYWLVKASTALFC